MWVRGIGVFSGRSGMEDFARNLKHGRNSARAIQNILGTKCMQRELIQYVSLPIRAKRGKRAALGAVRVLPWHEVVARQFAAEPDSFLLHHVKPELLCQFV